MQRHPDDVGWQRLRKDMRSMFAVLAAAVAALAATMSFIMLSTHGSQMENRANPLYWALMIPMVYWVTQIGTYRASSMKLLLPGQVIIPLIAAVALLLAVRQGQDPTAWIISLVIAVAGSACSAWLYRGSLLQSSVLHDPLES